MTPPRSPADEPRHDIEARWQRLERERAGFRSPAERAWYGVRSPLGYDEEARARDLALKNALNAVFEQPDEDWPDPAGFWRRALAFGLDVAVVLGVATPLLGFGWALVALFLYVWATNALGRSLGKWVAGIKVINDDKRRPGVTRGLVRTWLSMIDHFFLAPVVCIPVLGLLLVARWVEHEGTIHDTLSMTEVVIARPPSIGPPS